MNDTDTKSRTVLLVGNPNVGKSVLFNRLTGADAIVSNYPGTTVDFTSGTFVIDGTEYSLIDVPGAYSLEPRDKAEEVALVMLREHSDATVVIVLDTTRIERGLYLALEVMEKGMPMIVALNMMDVAKDKKIAVDKDKLSKILGVPVIPITAISGEGIMNLGKLLKQARPADVENLRRLLKEKE